MRHFSRALNAELSKYRKRKKISLDGSVPGAPYASFSRSRKHVSGMPSLPTRPSYHHDIYMSSTPQAYHPSLNAPAIQETEYDAYESFMPRVSRSPLQPRHNPHNTGQGQEMPGRISVPTKQTGPRIPTIQWQNSQISA